MGSKKKIVLVNVGGIALTVLVFISMVIWQKGLLRQDIHKELEVLSRNECEKIAKDVWLMLRTQHETLKKKLTLDLRLARQLVQQAGAVSLAQETIQWQATNQYTNQVKTVELPKMLVGNQWLGQVTSMDVKVPIVDALKELSGDTSTIFQRINEQGDMLRICTNVQKTDGTRAVGTYIPAINPDGTPNPVIQTVLSGQTYTGRAYVVNAWYITAYEPIKDQAGKVIGMLYVGVKQEDVPELRKGIMDIKVGKTGYVYILGGTGDQKGVYIISKDGARDGENIWNATDTDGRPFIQSVITKALATKDGQCDFERYPWKNQGEDKARWKIAAVTYFQPWDWVIGVGTYEDEFMDSLARIDQHRGDLVWYSGLGAIVAAVACSILAFLLATRIARPLLQAVGMLKEMAQGQGDLTSRLNVQSKDEVGELAKWFNGFMDKLHELVSQVANTAHTVASSATELAAASAQIAGQAQQLTGSASTVAASTEQMSTNIKNVASSTEQMSSNVRTVAAAVEQMTSCIKEIAKNADQAASIAQQAAKLAEESDGQIGQLGQAADQITKVVEVIQDIAEQTNLLALNATIEAARAGEAGKGFAVVANEVKELAKQTTEATEDIRRRVQAIQQSTGVAIKSIGQIKDSIKNVSEVSQAIASAVEEQSVTTSEIANNITQTASASEFVAQNISQVAAATNEITSSINTVGQAVQQTSDGVNNIQQATKDLSVLSEQLQGLVNRFKL
ncbi:MAG: methyl-accepting chemotaxis protein [Sedimentisphaerales bacterium]|nr:methyl-accepting chemotaxis protein [Sedimentisphaerales bacterium]